MTLAVPPSQRNRQPLLRPDALAEAVASGLVDEQQVAAALRSRENAPRRRRIGDVLVARGVLSQEQLDACLAEQAAVPPGQPRPRLGSVIIGKRLASEQQVAEALALAMGLEVIDLTRTAVTPEVARKLPREMAERDLTLLVAETGKQITVAVSDPTNVVALDDVRFHTGAATLRVVVATESQVREQLRRVWSLADTGDVASLFEAAAEVATVSDIDANRAAETAPIVRLVDMVFRDASNAGASDIHIETQLRDVRIRFRVDGVLRDVMSMPRNAGPAVVSRIKVVAGLDIAERRRPQDGRIRLTIDGRPLDARVSTLPSLHGEKVVIRLLSSGEDVPSIDRIMDERTLEILQRALTNPQGLVLITGPTGSGKTNTLYGAIQTVATPERNVVTLEDPVEVQFPGITQVQINEKAGMTFAAGLRSVLRQDPDVVLVGEVRDLETAELAVQASMTGHLVLTTLHTNDTVRAITRLVDMGLPPFLIASALTLVMAQRLVRRPCPLCVAADNPDEKLLGMLGLTRDDLAGATPKRGVGCPSCGGTGYSGRRAVFEVLPVTAELRAVMLDNPTESAIAAAARDGGLKTLRMVALEMARRGETTFEEVLRVTQTDAVGGGDGGHCRACTRPVEEAMAFCPWCGTPAERHDCRCGTRLQPAWSHCPACGTATHATAVSAPDDAALAQLLSDDA